jgi:ferredoxin
MVDADACTGDGICVDICPENVLEIADGTAATSDVRADTCIVCGQCVAVCPNAALQMRQLPGEDFHDLARMPFGPDDFVGFLKLRRSVRRFKDLPVDRSVIRRILEAAATAPMGLPPHSTAVLVIDRREELELLLERIVEDYSSTIRAFSNPVGRAVIRFTAGAENYHTLKHHVVDVARYANELYHADGTDRYTYHAPVLMLFHGNRWAMSYEENAHLVCHHAMLAALSLGLGTTIIGLIPPIVDRSRALRRRYGIPKDDRVVTSLILGYPKYRYKKSIRRELAAVKFA